MKIPYQPLPDDAHGAALRAELEDAGIDPSEAPSFKRLRSHTPPPQRQLRRKRDAGAPSGRLLPRTALAVAFFVAGAAIGFAGAWLIASGGDVSRALIDHRLMPFAPIAAVGGQNEAGLRFHPDRKFAPAAGRMSGNDGAPPEAVAIGPAAAPNVAALVALGERQIAEHQLEEPAGNNALETYRRIAAKDTDGHDMGQFGEHLSAAIHLRAVAAMREKRWDAAVHYFNVLRSLPPVPISAYLADSGGSSAPDRPPAPPSKETASNIPSKLDAAGATPVPQIPPAPGAIAAPEAGHPVPAPQSAQTPASPLTASAPAEDDSRLKQAFDRFLSEQGQRSRTQKPISPQDKVALFSDFLRWRTAHSAAPSNDRADNQGTPPAAGDRWQAREQTNLRKEPSVKSPVIGVIAKGEEFQVIGTSADREWLEVERADGTTAYYWSTRAKKVH